MVGYITRHRNGELHEILVDAKYAKMINTEFVMKFPIADGEEIDVLPYKAFTDFLRIKGINITFNQ